MMHYPASQLAWHPVNQVLASFGTRKGSGTKRQYGVAGNSFVAVVEFGEKVQAKSMLAGGQSADPNSVHFDQMQRYADRKFKTVAFYREDVLKRAEYEIIIRRQKLNNLEMKTIFKTIVHYPF